MSDPFHAVQGEVRATLEDIQTDLAKWKKIPAKSPKSEPKKKELLAALSELQVDLQDMQATIDIALNDPAKFALTPSELMTRQDFVRDLQAQANDARETLESGPVPGGRLAARGSAQRFDRQELLTSSTRASELPVEEDIEAGGRRGGRDDSNSAAWQDNENVLQQAQMEQAQADQRQADALKTIEQSVDRLDHMGRVINDELKQQGRELDAFTEEVDVVSDKMTAATKVMKKMLKRKDRGKLCAILILTIVLIGLIYAVFEF